MPVFIRAKGVPLILGILFLPVMTYAQKDMNSFTLEVAIEIALKENPRLLAAQKEVAAARGRSWSTWWLPDPAFTAEYEQIPTGKGLGSFGERRLAITQSIDFPVNIFFKKKFASNDVNVSRMGFEQTKLEVITDVKKAYTTFLAKREQVQLARQNLQLAHEFLDKAQTRYDVGKAPMLELVRARVAAAQAENDLSLAQKEFTAAQATLNALLARPAETPVNAADTLAYRTFAPSLSELRQLALQRHPRLRAQTHRVGMAQQLRNLAWGSFLPTIEASAFRQTIEGNSDFYGVELGLSIPLWFPFRQRGNIQEARGLLSAAQYRLQNERHLLDADIEGAYAALQSSKEQVRKYNDTLLQQADEVYRIALRSYEEGKVGYLQLLEAQQTLVAIRRGYIDALASYLIAVAELERATGVEIER